MPSLDEINRRFRPVKGTAWPGGLWEDGENLVGDCWNYANSVGASASGGWAGYLLSLLFARAVIWGTFNNRGAWHAMLWRAGAGWIDSNNRQWSERPVYRRILPVSLMPHGFAAIWGGAFAAVEWGGFDHWILRALAGAA